MHLGRFPDQVVFFGADDRRRKLDLKIAARFGEVNRSHPEWKFVVKKSVRLERYFLPALGHSVPIGVPLIGENFCAASRFLEGIAASVVAREGKLGQPGIIGPPEIRVHLLINVETRRNVQNLIHLQHLDDAAPLPVVRFHQLIQIEWLAHQDMENLSLTRLTVAHDLSVVDVELGFAIVPITRVLDEGWRELAEGGPGSTDRNRDQSKKLLLHGAPRR